MSARDVMRLRDAQRALAAPYADGRAAREALAIAGDWEALGAAQLPEYLAQQKEMRRKRDAGLCDAWGCTAPATDRGMCAECAADADATGGVPATLRDPRGEHEREAWEWVKL